MTTDHDSAPQAHQNQRKLLPVWVALGVAVVLAIVSLMAIVHRPGVPALEPGHKGAVRISGRA